MIGPKYTKLGQSEPNGVMHAVRGETLDNWEGPESFCGKRIGATVTRNRMDANLRCSDCREVMGLRTLRRPERKLSFESRQGRWQRVGG